MPMSEQAAKPSDLELQVLSLLWERGPMTVREVLEAMPDGKERAYTTVLSVMQVMERKGLLTHRQDGKTNIYRASRGRKKVLGPILRNMVQNVFGDSPSAAMQFLLQETDASDDELRMIRQMLDERRAKSKGETT